MNSKRSSHRSLSGCPSAAAKSVVFREAKYRNGFEFRPRNPLPGSGLYESMTQTRDSLEVDKVHIESIVKL